MDTKWQALGLTAILLVSFVFTQHHFSSKGDVGQARDARTIHRVEGGGQASLAPLVLDSVIKAPTRDWEVLDPDISSRAVLIQSLDDSFPFLHRETYALWPAASLTKLLTAVVVLEEAGADIKLTITERAVATEGLAGDLRHGEIFLARDLLKVMLIASSNDAAAAFEDYFGGEEIFVSLINKKARELGMTSSVFYDGSGLSDLNVTTASDMLRLVKYILRNHPEILQWTRIPSFLVQPINDIESRLIYSVISFSDEEDFLGGKTGTSPRAGENLVAVFSFETYRLAVILLGSSNRVGETERLLNWIQEAYSL